MHDGARTRFFSFPSFLWIHTLIYFKPKFTAYGPLLQELQLTGGPNLAMSLFLAPLEDLADSDCGILLSFFWSLFVSGSLQSVGPPVF